MPFCARCLGSSIGHIGAFFLFLLSNLPNIPISLLFIFILGIDWSLQRWFGIMSTNHRRLFTGILGGIGVGAIIWNILSYGFRLIKGVI